jgi:hypothetical protein
MVAPEMGPLFLSSLKFRGAAEQPGEGTGLLTGRRAALRILDGFEC